ncbi:MAG: protein kinase, partial [Deltaproteobacteria bacterium]|nr:protein kinase [Deltaproteobacteria bacterium]
MRDDESTDDDAGLGERPAGDSLALEVAQSRVANALFATEERVRIGRYHLLQHAGAGGMGVVWSAWDPELERRVAIKLMHVKSETARAYMLREGQSLAKLSHPNIVPIYDVGTIDEQVYLVMEWIAGITLRA